MNTDYLEEFAYLSETLSFTKTAKRFYTSRSVISRHVAALERELGVRLLERDRRSVSLTKEGDAFRRQAQVLIDDLKRLVEYTHEAGGGAERNVRIGYLRNAARPFIIRFANCLKDEHPQISPIFSCMRYDELCQAMAEGRIDLALSMDFAGQLEGRYRSWPVYEDQLYAVLSDSDPLASRAGGIASDDLAGRRLLLSDSLACPGLNGYLVEAFGAKAAFISFEYVDDDDVTQLRLHVDGSIALRSGRNLTLPGTGTVALPLSDVDLSFTANAYLIDSLDDTVAAACRETVRECAEALRADRAGEGCAAVAARGRPA